MGIGDWMAIVAVVISLTSLMMSLINRKQDIAREEAYRIRARVWEILNGEPGSRSISALDQSDGKTGTRIELLRRTAEQLKLAGALDLGSHLESFLSRTTWPNADEKSRKAREEFRRAAAEFMQPK
jgi:hypothetical protein